MKQPTIILSILLISCIALAEGPTQTPTADEYLKSDNFNGRFWLRLSEDEKAIYIIGMVQGITMCAEPKIKFEKIANISADEATIKKIYQWQEIYLPYKIPMAEIIRYIDDYYKFTYKLDEPINNAYFRMVEGMLIGEGETDLHGRLGILTERAVENNE